ncbi:antitoxin [Nodosilinea sp. LEGE 06152]|uniref:antitoxin n=1 Tax=Nodosilinea sp. LEGE 06152 TaxID=2777966 RepID=UPI0018823DE5|nr:antitoxin [Nodosilinea sp. LEGE 06152]MBE9157745.1 antitoxin [Nodosilinea sp. LEGE 06152]
MKDVKLTPEEQELLKPVKNDGWLSVPNREKEIKRYQSYAKAQLGELEEIKIEIPSQDLQFLQALAAQAQTSLQTMIANLLHQFVVHNLEGQIHNRP